MYDFMNDEMPSGERIPYKVMRWWFLDCYYSFCKIKIINKNESGEEWSTSEHESGYAYEQQENSYQLPIEKLMLEVLVLVLDGGRGSQEFYSYHKNKISDLLQSHDLTAMRESICGEERREFESDLRLLQLIL
jgi:hypothetical protein